MCKVRPESIGSLVCEKNYFDQRHGACHCFMSKLKSSSGFTVVRTEHTRKSPGNYRCLSLCCFSRYVRIECDLFGLHSRAGPLPGQAGDHQQSSGERNIRHAGPLVLQTQNVLKNSVSIDILY